MTTHLVALCKTTQAYAKAKYCKRATKPTHQVVSKAYYDKLRQVADSRLSGEKIFFELEDLQAAKAYLSDACNYMCPQN